MIDLKTNEEIQFMIKGGKILKIVFNNAISTIKPQKTTQEIEKIIDKTINSYRAQASFKTVPGYKYASCISLNHQIVHTPPSLQIIQPGDIITLDIGVFYRGFHTDKAVTFQIEPYDRETQNFLKVGKTTLEKAISQAKEGRKLSEISKTISKNITCNGYKVIYELTGHGIGRQLHEDPFIPGYYDKETYQDIKLENGMVLAIEVIYSQSTNLLKSEKNNPWSLVTKNKCLSACFEKTIVINKNTPLILT